MFMRACLFKQQLNIIRTYSKPLKIQSSSIYGTENLNSFIAVPLTTDTDLYAPGCATQPSTGFSAYWLCCNDSALGLMKSWLCCGKGGRWGRRTLRLETGRESSTLILTVLILFGVRERGSGLHRDDTAWLCSAPLCQSSGKNTEVWKAFVKSPLLTFKTLPSSSLVPPCLVRYE